MIESVCRDAPAAERHSFGVRFSDFVSVLERGSGAGGHGTGYIRAKSCASVREVSTFRSLFRLSTGTAAEGNTGNIRGKSVESAKEVCIFQVGFGY